MRTASGYRHRAAKWLKEAAPNAKIVARNNSVLGLMYAVKSGVGVGALPTAIADTEPDLVRVLGPILNWREAGGYWLTPIYDARRALRHFSISSLKSEKR